MRAFMAKKGVQVPDEVFDDSRRLQDAANAVDLDDLQNGAFRLRPNFCSWNVKMTLEFQAEDFPGFKMVFGSMGFKTGDSFFYEFGGPEYKTQEDFRLPNPSRGYDGHFWMTNEETGEVADVPFPTYRIVSNFRCQDVNAKRSYKMKPANDWKWVIMQPTDWLKYGMVHVPAPAAVQKQVYDEFVHGEWGRRFADTGGNFEKAKVRRVRNTHG